VISALRNLTRELEVDHSLGELHRFRERIEAMDRLDAYPLERQFSALDSESVEARLYRRARALYAKLEAANLKFYDTIRDEIQRGANPNQLYQWISKSSNVGDLSSLAAGESYDYLDELVSGALRFAKPDAQIVQLPAEMVCYQPTPARHIFDLIAHTQLTERDVLIDLGSGLGHVPLLSSICTGARSIGIEIEAAYVNCARQSAYELNLNNVTFIEQDARETDLSSGTVFYLYTPFLGTILRAVMDLLRREAVSREIRICTFGPCTPTVGEERWLEPIETLEAGRIAVFRSGSGGPWAPVRR
jgi:Histone methylation protein DOT1